ncbi:MAG: hypothetical protein HQL72_11295 [Magnetococcales bacterium]|nr:hypothetical protein [Magnetococcales bacterium]
MTKHVISRFLAGGAIIGILLSLPSQAKAGVVGTVVGTGLMVQYVTMIGMSMRASQRKKEDALAIEKALAEKKAEAEAEKKALENYLSCSQPQKKRVEKVVAVKKRVDVPPPPKHIWLVPVQPAYSHLNQPIRTHYSTPPGFIIYR